MTPLVTVLVCTHNDAATLPAALESALGQTLPRDRYAVVVVDDGSTDETATVVERYDVESIRLAENVGLPAAANAGLERIRSQFFVRIDADDTVAPQLLEELLAAAEAQNANFVYTDRLEASADGDERVIRLDGEPGVALLVAAGKLLPTELVREVGGYRDLFWEEFDLDLRLLETGRLRSAHVPLPLYRYTVGRAGRMTSDDAAVQRGWKELRALWPVDVLDRYGLAAAAGLEG